MEQFNTIPTSGNWSDIAGILDANFFRCYTALVQSESLVGLSSSNFQGIYASASTLPEMSSSGWALVGSSLSALTLYVYNTGSSEWGELNSTAYNFTDFSEFQTQLDALSSQVATIGSKIGDLTQLETTDKTDLVSAINEVKNNASSTAQDTTYVDNKGLGVDNVQDALDLTIGTQDKIVSDYYKDIPHDFTMPKSGWIRNIILDSSDTEFLFTTSTAANSRYVYILPYYVKGGSDITITMASGSTSTDVGRVYFLKEMPLDTDAMTILKSDVVANSTHLYYGTTHTFKVPNDASVILFYAWKVAVATNTSLGNVHFETREKSVADISESEFAYLTGREYFNFDSAVVGVSHSTYMSVEKNTETAQITISALGVKATSKFAYIRLDGLKDGVRYSLSFDVIGYSFSSNSDGYISLSLVSSGLNGQSAAGWIGHNVSSKSKVELTFVKSDVIDCLMMSNISLGTKGSYLTIGNISVRIARGSEYDYENLSVLEDRVEEIEKNFPDYSEATIVWTYDGLKIPSPVDRNKFGTTKICNNIGCQGGAAYNGYWFQFADHHASLSVYDLENKVLHSTVEMTAVQNDHCNNACFSNIFFDENDTFPLIYTSGSGYGTYNHIQVWRIQYTDDVFTIEQIQEITLPTGAEGNTWYWGQAYLDNDLNYLWYSTNMADAAHFRKMRIPSIFDADNNVVSTVQLTDNDVLDSFTTERNRNQQGGVLVNGILYLMDGIPSRGKYTRLYVYDIWGKRLMNVVDFYNVTNLHGESEGLGYWNGKFILAFNGNGLYYIYL